MAVRKNDFMPSWLQSPNGEGQKAWKSGSGRDGLYVSSDSHAPPVSSSGTSDMRRFSPFPAAHDNAASVRRPQRALSFEASLEHPSYSRPIRPPSGYRRPPGKSEFGVSSMNGGGSTGAGAAGSNMDSFSRPPRQQRPSDGWPRPEPSSSNQGLDRNFHQHFPTLRGTSSAAPDHSSFNPGGAWDHRHSQGSVRAHYSLGNSNGSFDNRRMNRPTSYSLESSPTDEEGSSRMNAKAVSRHDRIPYTQDPQPDPIPTVRNSTAERSNMRLNLSLNSTSAADLEKTSGPARQTKVQSPNGAGKVTLRSLSKSETRKPQKQAEEPPVAPAPSAHSAVAPWSSQAPPPPPALPRSSAPRLPEAPAVLLQRQMETRSKGTSESRLNFFKSLQGDNGTSSNEGSPGNLTPATETNHILGTTESHAPSSATTSDHDSCRSSLQKLNAETKNLTGETSPGREHCNRLIDRDHLTASFYDVIINSGKIPFDDTDDVNEEDLRVLKVWGWTPDAYDNVECITLGEVATFQALFRSYVNKKRQTDFQANCSLGAQRLFQRHSHYLTLPSALGTSLSSSDCSEESASASLSSSSDEDRK